MARQTPQVQDVLDEYMRTRQHLAENTLINDRSVLNGFVRHLGKIQIGHVTAEHVESYFLGDAGIGTRMNAASFNKCVQRVRGFLDFAARRGYNRKPLLDNVRARRVFRRDRLRLTPTQLLDLLEVTDDPRDRGLLAVAINTGLRSRELTAIRIGDVNLTTGFLHVTISKSGFEDQMPIPRELDAELRRWLGEYHAGAPRRLNMDDHLFPARQAPSLRRLGTSGGPRPQQPRDLRPDVVLKHPERVVQRALRNIGLEIESGEGFHTIRRSVARAFFDSASDAGHDEALRMTSSFLHHSATQTTEVYLGLQHERVKRDQMLRGMSFLGALVPTENVVKIRKTDAAGSG